MTRVVTKSIPDRLRNIEPYTTEPEPMWEMRRVCEAFMLPVRAATKLVPVAHKRRVMTPCRDWRFRQIISLIDRAGINLLACRYNRQFSRHEIMAALNDSIRN